MNESARRKALGRIRAVIAVAFLAGITLVPFTTVKGCAVSVHRYLLERWDREFYRIYYFHGGEADEKDRDVNTFLKETSSSYESHVNLAFRIAEVNTETGEPVSVGDKMVWEEHGSDELPFHLVLTPLGTQLFRGRLDLPLLKAMTHSPLRTKMAEALCRGKDALLLLLTSTDPEENERVEKDIEHVLKEVKEQDELDVAFLKLQRGAPEEKWLQQSLLELVGESDDEKYCVVFGIVGRGRVLTGCLGEGIDRENLMECVYVMNGDCSCDLRMANPGMDLMTDWDWETAIANLPSVIDLPIASVLVDLDESEEGREAAGEKKTESESERERHPLFGTEVLGRWGLAFGIACITVLTIGVVIIRRRKEF